MHLQCGSHRLTLDEPVVMGVVNVTPDSFADGGRYLDPGRAIAQAERLVAEGAAIVDIGGESTRPGARPVTAGEEAARVVPVVAALVPRLGVPVSVDTRRAGVMRAVIDAGATLINDVTALADPGAIEICAASGVAVCLMHMRGEPATMQVAPAYADVVREVGEFLAERVRACHVAGIDAGRIAVDPGFGFGKTLEHNLDLLAALPELERMGFPVLVGLSRKSMIGTLTGRPVDERLYGSVALAALAVMNGARIVRAHDVAPTLDAVKVAAALRRRRE
ncbi:MAG: dihydropteroate synthase [Steroidobacteraceae bacterium]